MTPTTLQENERTAFARYKQAVDAGVSYSKCLTLRNAWLQTRHALNRSKS